MRHINGVYTQRYNRRNSHDGQLFRGRYKSKQLREYREFIGEEDSEEIGKEFNVPNYSSVSSIIESMKANLAGNKKLRKRVDYIKRDLQLSQK